MTEQLKPCPFCGSNSFSVFDNLSAIVCNACRMSSPVLQTKEEVVKFWNTRVPVENPAVTTRQCAKCLYEFYDYEVTPYLLNNEVCTNVPVFLCNECFKGLPPKEQIV